jgi:hypothetical protein
MILLLVLHLLLIIVENLTQSRMGMGAFFKLQIAMFLYYYTVWYDMMNMNGKVC